MTRLLLMLFALLASCSAFSQDSATATYINTLVEQIESRLAADASVVHDTAITDPADSGHMAGTLRIRTEYFFRGHTNLIEKITEETHYGNWSTQTIVYFSNSRAIRFSTLERKKDSVQLDFDVYYMHDTPVHFVRRFPLKGKPDCTQFLKWSYELYKGYHD